MKIESVIRGSPADRAGLRPGDEIVSINGRRIRDQIDLRFYGSEERLEVKVSRGGRIRRLILEKEADRQLGAVAEDPRWRRCANRCLFCFVDQMPKGLRPSLYVKDEDYRLSFLHGNYLTLTGFSSSDRGRVIEQRLSPLYVSVHASDQRVRGRLLGAGRAAPIMPLIRDLVRHGIELHTQIVLCPGINDGKVLERTVDDLVALHPGVASIAVVPVGLTSHRRNLPRLSPVDGGLAGQIIARYRPLQEKLRKKFNKTVLYFSDEFYLLAGLDMPKSIWYDDYPQIENGVGMTRLFGEKIKQCSLSLPLKLKSSKKIALVTGMLAKPALEPVIEKYFKINKLDMRLVAVGNRLFGPSVTVSGLLSGRDILDALSGESGLDLVALPENVVNDEGMFIDGLTVRRFRALAMPARVVFGLDSLAKKIASWAG